MKHIILTLAFALVLIGAKAGLPPGSSITNIRVSQGKGGDARVLDILFDLSGIDLSYNIALEVSFDNGASFAPIDPGEVTGNTTVAPGADIHLVWDGRISYAGETTSQARIKITATTWNCGDLLNYQGQDYATVLIGTQCWMAENLNAAKDAAGNDITRYCYGDQTTNCDTYGGLYTWTTMMNGASSSNSVPSGVQGICPDGWHVPGDAEWTILTNYVKSQSGYRCSGNSSWIGKSLASKTGWDISPDACAVGNDAATNNATGFSGLSAGRRNDIGHFYFAGRYGYWWTSTEDDSNVAKICFLYFGIAEVNRGGTDKTVGYSVRCLR